MGLTNTFLNIIRCILLAKDMCRNGTAYIPTKVQHGTIHDLLDSSAVFETLQTRYHVKIHLYCSDAALVASRGWLVEAEIDHRGYDPITKSPLMRFLTMCLDGPLFVKDAFSTHYGDSKVTQDMLMTLVNHPAAKVAKYVATVRSGLMSKVSSQLQFFNTIHLRLESDAWILMAKQPTSKHHRVRLLETQLQNEIKKNSTRRCSVVLHGVSSQLRLVVRNGFLQM
eukprot:PhF_6_TR37452/c0_g1_i3/m.55077